MTLTNRLTLFFLAAQVMVLAAFSVTLYVLARSHLYDQLDVRLSTTMDTLVALAEIEPDGLDWEPELRRLPAHWEGAPPVWAIYDEHDNRIDGSNSSVNDLTEFASLSPTHTREMHCVEWNGSDWRVARQILVFPESGAVRSRPGRERYQTLVFVTAWPVAPVQGELRTLAWGLAGVSVVVWLLSGLGSRWVCQRVLAPVSRMTKSAKRITAADLGERLPTPAARDELYDLAGSFNDLLARLQDSFERQRRFTGEASHQLRTPLTAMLGQMEVALRRDREPEEYRRVLTTAVAQAGRLRQIVESLLFLARADADAELPGLEVINLAAWVGEYLANSPHDRTADVQFAVPSASVQIKVHPAMLAQVVGNLVENACKYSDPGTPVAVSVTAEGDVAVLAVEDAGYGIEVSEVERIFEPFFRSSQARRRGASGLGLGLAVAGRIVRSLGGCIEVKSEPGRGSRFTVRLPIDSHPLGRSTSTAPNCPDQQPRQPGAEPRIEN